MPNDAAYYARQSDPELNRHFRRTWTGPTVIARHPVIPDAETRIEDRLRQERAAFLAGRANRRLVGDDRLGRQVPR